jgi:hypothetical protein
MLLLLLLLLLLLSFERPYYRYPDAIAPGAFDSAVVLKYKYKSAMWWKVYCKNASMRALANRTQRCKPSSSSAERNWSIWGLILTKIRNRLLLSKAMKLVFMYQNIRMIRKIRNSRVWMPNLNFDSSVEAETDEFEVRELDAWMDDFATSAMQQAAEDSEMNIAYSDDDDDDDDDDDYELSRVGERRGPPAQRTPAEERAASAARVRRRRISTSNDDDDDDDDFLDDNNAP